MKVKNEHRSKFSKLSNWIPIAQLLEQRTGNAEVTGSNPVEALIFFRLLLSNSLNWEIYCDDHSSLSFICCWHIVTELINGTFVLVN